MNSRESFVRWPHGVTGLLAGAVAREAPLLPWPNYAPGVRIVILTAVAAAWVEVNRICDVRTLTEPEITTMLEQQLNKMMRDETGPNGFNSALFETVVRDASVFTFDGRHIEKKPDLTFRLIDTKLRSEVAAHRAFFVECKALWDNGAVSRYCSQGIRRFVVGEYAWAVSSAAMIGYQDGSKEVATDLEPYLERDRKSGNSLRTVRLPGEEAVVTVAGGYQAYFSQHDRPWRYPQSERGPGEISLAHLWLRVTAK